MIRVVVVEDSSTARALLVHLLNSDPEIEVVAEASDGIQGVELVQKLKPDVVTMDVHMPGLDGLAATKELMITVPTPIILVTGTSSTSDVNLAMSALRAGAVAVIRKPLGLGSVGFEDAAQHLVTTVKSMASVKVVRHWRRPGTLETPLPMQGIGNQDGIVGIVASTGGPAALQTLFAGLPGNYPVPILVVQHITPGFAHGFAEWLNASSHLRVKLAESGESIVGHTVYIAPDDQHLGVGRKGKIALSNDAAINGFRPSGSYLFESLAERYTHNVTAIVLTGINDDGVAGLKAVRRQGGKILVEDEKSCVAFTTPSAAIAAGYADAVLPIEGIAARLVAGRDSTSKKSW